MPALHAIATDKLVRLIGTPNAPAIIDIRPDAAFAAEPRFIPASLRRPAETVADWSAAFAARSAIVVCEDGGAASQGVAAWLRYGGIAAEALEGGLAGWRGEGLPLVPEAPLPTRDAQGRTLWVTRARPKVDRIACPWLIRRFVDPAAVFLYVPPADVLDVAVRFDGAAFDLDGDGVFWSHRGERCTFDTMVEAFGLDGQWLADIQRYLPQPDLTVLLDIEPQVSASRKTADRDKYERDLALLGRVRESYLRQASSARWLRLDAGRDRDAVAADVHRALQPLLA